MTRTFEHDGVALAYDDSGEPDRVPVVLLHGLSLARTSWATLAAALADRARVITLDQRGHGESSHAPGAYTLEHYGPDTIAFCEQVVGAPAVLIGHSLGGVIAAFGANRRPDLVRGIVLEDPPLYRGDPNEEPSGVAAFFPAMRQMFRGLRERSAGIEEYEEILRAAPSTTGQGTRADMLGPEGTRAQAEAWARLDPETFTPAIDGAALTGAPDAIPPGCPVLVLRADPALGPAFTADDETRFLAANPHATVTVVDGAGHGIHEEQPDRFRAEVSAFLDALGVSPAG